MSIDREKYSIGRPEYCDAAGGDRVVDPKPGTEVVPTSNYRQALNDDKERAGPSIIPIAT